MRRKAHPYRRRGRSRERPVSVQDFGPMISDVQRCEPNYIYLVLLLLLHYLKLLHPQRADISRFKCQFSLLDLLPFTCCLAANAAPNPADGRHAWQLLMETG